jgi:hypothetical protein
LGLAAVALLGAGCLESTPSPIKSPLGDAGFAQPPPEPSDAGAEVDAELDAELDDAAPSDAAPASDGGAAAWAGTWIFVSGSQGIACGNALLINAVSGFLDITPSRSGTSLSVTEDGCPFHFALSGDTASVEPGQACAVWAIPTIPTWTLTMQPNGTLTEKLGGRVAMGGEVCTISGGSTLRRQ